MSKPITDAEELRDNLATVVRDNLMRPGWSVTKDSGEYHSIVLKHLSGEAYRITVFPSE